MSWKHFANWLKLIVGIEIAGMFFVGNGIFHANFSAMDLVTIGLFQYGIFFPIDVSMVVKAIKGEVISQVSIPTVWTGTDIPQTATNATSVTYDPPKVAGDGANTTVTGELRG